MDWKGPLQLPARLAPGREASIQHTNAVRKVQRKVQITRPLLFSLAFLWSQLLVAFSVVTSGRQRTRNNPEFVGKYGVFSTTHTEFDSEFTCGRIAGTLAGGTGGCNCGFARSSRKSKLTKRRDGHRRMAKLPVSCGWNLPSPSALTGRPGKRMETYAQEGSSQDKDANLSTHRTCFS